jgi:hypothetical protein
MPNTKKHSRNHTFKPTTILSKTEMTLPKIDMNQGDGSKGAGTAVPNTAGTVMGEMELSPMKVGTAVT